MPFTSSSSILKVMLTSFVPFLVWKVAATTWWVRLMLASSSDVASLEVVFGPVGGGEVGPSMLSGPSVGPWLYGV